MITNTLKGRVVEMFGSVKAFSDKLCWSYRRTSDIVSGRQVPTADDISQMANALDVTSPEDFMRIFFASSVHNVDTT